MHINQCAAQVYLLLEATKRHCDEICSRDKTDDKRTHTFRIKTVVNPSYQFCIINNIAKMYFMLK